VWLGYTFPGSEPLNPIVRFGFALGACRQSCRQPMPGRALGTRNFRDSTARRGMLAGATSGELPWRTSERRAT
jgi:hypothetical protein